MLESNERFEVKKCSPDEWHYILSLFTDASVFQTSEFGSVNWGSRNFEHAVLYRDNVPVSACQMRIIRIPLNGNRIICSNAGPLWKTFSGKSSLLDLEKIIYEMKKRYVSVKKNTLVLKPWVFRPCVEAQEVADVFEKCGFVYRKLDYTTAYLPLSSSLETIKSSIDRRWRQKLSKAEKLGLRTEVGKGLECFDYGLSIYKEMIRRKRIIAEDMPKYQLLNKMLPEDKRFQTVICFDDEGPLSFLSCSVFGDTAIALFAATSNRALELNSSFLTWWRMIEILKSENVSWINVGGLNKERNPGSYRFKSGLYKRSGYECDALGQFWCCGSPMSRYTSEFLLAGKTWVKNGKRFLENRMAKKISN